jgi:hypothetical protein
MDLIQELVKQVGVSETQAKGGAGMLLKLAQSHLSGTETSALANAIPNLNDLIKQTPSSSGAAGLLGALASKMGAGQLGDLASMAGGLSSLNIDKETIAKFVPVILNFLKSQGHPELAALIGKFFPKM